MNLGETRPNPLQPSITFSGIDAMNVSLGTGGGEFTVASTIAATSPNAVTINTGPGNKTVKVLASSAPLIVKDVLDMLAAIRKSGVTVLMVEQNFKAAVKVADRFYIMSKGQMVFEGDLAALMAADDVRRNYLEV